MQLQEEGGRAHKRQQLHVLVAVKAGAGPAYRRHKVQMAEIVVDVRCKVCDSFAAVTDCSLRPVCRQISVTLSRNSLFAVTRFVPVRR